MSQTNRTPANVLPQPNAHVLNPLTGKPVSNPALDKAGKALRENNTPENLNAVINEVTRAFFLIPATVAWSGTPPKPDEKGRVVLPKDTKITFSVIKSTQDKAYFPAFSCEEELRKGKFPNASQIMLLRFDDYARMLEQNKQVSGFVVDPFGNNLRFDAPLVASVKKQRDTLVARAKAGLRQIQVKPGDKVTIVEPSLYPDQLLDPLCEVLAGMDTVAAAYLQVMLVNDTTKYYLVVLDAPRNDQMMAAVAKAAHAYMANPDRKMDVNITTSDTVLGRQGMRDSEPFYIRGKGRVDNLDDDE